MTSFIRYRTYIPYSGYTWTESVKNPRVDDLLLIPNEGEMKSDELPDDAYLEFLSTVRKVLDTSDIEEKKNLIEDFTLKYGSLMQAERMLFQNPDQEGSFVSDQEHGLVYEKEQLYNSIPGFEDYGTAMLDFMNLHKEGELGEVTKILEGLKLSATLRAEKVKGKIKTIFYSQTLAGTLMYQLAMTMNQMGKLKICVQCGDPFAKREGSLTCSDNCRQAKSKDFKKQEKK